MADNKESTVEKAAAREKLEQHWLGRFQYTVEGVGVVPDYMYTEWYTPEGVTRKVCIKLDENNKPVWMLKEDAPPPANTFDPNTANKSQHEINPAAAQPSFDYNPPAYNSDTHSGGPSNFDGNAGGDNNPRNPLLEGENGNDYAEEVADYKERLEKMEAKFKDLEKASKKKPAKGADALKDLINGPSE